MECRSKYNFSFRFFEKDGFPVVIDTIDGTHVAIFSFEAEREYLFINR